MISRYYAVRELLDNGITSLPIMTEDIKAVINNKGFKIINYDVSNNQHASILKNLGVFELADRSKAFTYSDKEDKFVFVKIGTSTNDRRLLLAHELGHISLRHVSDNTVIGYKPGGLIDEGQEDEANAFALEFLAPVCVLNRKHINKSRKISAFTLLDEKRSKLVASEVHNYKNMNDSEAELCRHFGYFEEPQKSYIGKNIIKAIAAIIITVIIVGVTTPISKLDLNNTISSPTILPIKNVAPTIMPYANQETSADVVYTTKTGKKFHKRNCRHLQNSTEISERNLQDALNIGYEPCRDCFSELN